MRGWRSDDVVCLLAVLVLGLAGAACGGAGEAGPGETPDAAGAGIPWPATVPGSQTVFPSPLPTEALTEGDRGLRIVSVVPPPWAGGPWTGDQVIVGYLPRTARLDPERCRLYINGRRQEARVRRNAVSPGQPILIFRLPGTFPPGPYEFRAVLVAGRERADYRWDFFYDLTYH